MSKWEGFHRNAEASFCCTKGMVWADVRQRSNWIQSENPKILSDKFRYDPRIEDLQEIPWKLSILVRNLWIFEAGFETRPVIYNASFLSVVMVTKTTEVDLPTIQPFSVGKTSMRLAASRVVATKVLAISLLGRVASKVFWRRQTGWGRKVSKSHELIDHMCFSNSTRVGKSWGVHTLKTNTELQNQGFVDLSPCPQGHVQSRTVRESMERIKKNGYLMFVNSPWSSRILGLSCILRGSQRRTAASCVAAKGDACPEGHMEHPAVSGNSARAMWDSYWNYHFEELEVE